MEKTSVIRTVYLYLFALVGLTLIVIGAVGFLQMGLKMYVFTQADQDQYLRHVRPPTLPVKAPQITETENGEPTTAKGTVELSEEQKTAINNWIEDYKKWQEEKEKTDPITSDRHQDASRYLALILIGAPLYAYHWRIIRKS